MLENQKLLRLASVLFMVQGFAWTLFSFLCILCIENVITPIITYEDSYSLFLLNNIFAIFFTKDGNHSESHMVVKPLVFEGFAFIHLILGINWLTLSGFVYHRSSDKATQSFQKSRPILISWLVSGYLVALFDGLFTILLMVDMIETCRLYGIGIAALYMPAISLVFIIVSRGFTLWILNVTFIVKFSITMWKSRREHRQNEFETRYGSQYGGNAYANNGYQPTSPTTTQQNQYIYPPAAHQQRQQQQHSGAQTPPVHQDYVPYRHQNLEYPTNAPSYPSAAPTLPYAQINRNIAPGRQSPPRLHAVSPPQIPEPDYQMGPRTVLKNRSQYQDRY